MSLSCVEKYKTEEDWLKDSFYFEKKKDGSPQYKFIDKVNKIHPVLVASYYPLDLQYDRTLWDKKIDELEAILDPLDRMSVIIRNVALALYKDTKQSYRNWKAFSKDIENVCSENKEALTQLQNLRFAYQSILDGRVNAMAQWKDAVESIAVQ